MRIKDKAVCVCRSRHLFASSLSSLLLMQTVNCLIRIMFDVERTCLNAFQVFAIRFVIRLVWVWPSHCVHHWQNVSNNCTSKKFISKQIQNFIEISLKFFWKRQITSWFIPNRNSKFVQCIKVKVLVRKMQKRLWLTYPIR